MPLAVPAGAAAAAEPRLVLGLVAGCLALLGVVSHHARLTMTVFGALLVFQSSDAVTVQKLAYVAALASFALVATYGLVGAWNRLAAVQRKIVVAGGVWLAIVLLSSVNALISGATLTQWLRLALPYLMVTLLIVIGIDAGRVVSVRFVMIVSLAAGLIGAMGEMVLWAGRRGLWDAGLTYVALPSPTLTALAIGLCLAIAVMWPERRLAGAAGAAALLSISLAVGTRTNAFLTLGMMGLAGSRKRGLLPLRLLAPASVVIGAAGLGMAVLLSSNTVERESYLVERLRTFVPIAQEGVSADASLVARENALRSTWSTFRESPVFGVGPGASVTGPLDAAARVDTPITMLAQFGLVGLAGLALLAWAFAAIVKVERYGKDCVFALATRVAVFALALPLLVGGVFAEKGLALAVGLALAGRTAEIRRQSESAERYTADMAVSHERGV